LEIISFNILFCHEGHEEHEYKRQKISRTKTQRSQRKKLKINQEGHGEQGVIVKRNLDPFNKYWGAVFLIYSSLQCIPCAKGIGVFHWPQNVADEKSFNQPEADRSV
jgi:hypothetical protein